MAICVLGPVLPVGKCPSALCVHTLARVILLSQTWSDCRVQRHLLHRSRDEQEVRADAGGTVLVNERLGVDEATLTALSSSAP